MAETASGIATQDPGGPALNLPAWEGATPAPQRPRIEITAPRPSYEERPYQAPPEAAPEAKPSPPAVAGFEERPYKAEETAPREGVPEFSGLEAAGEGFLNMFSFGAAPMLGGLANVAGPEWIQQDRYGPSGNPIAPIIGAYKMAANWASSHPDPAVKEAYDKGREAGQKYHEEAYQQHPAAYIAGMATAAPFSPSFGALRAAGTAGRIAQGMRAGGLGGLAYGVGSSGGEGLAPEDALKRTALTTGLGAATGGLFNYALGPRLAATGPGTGDAAARTAAGLGEPLARGYSSDSPFLQGTLSKLRSLPFVGSRITGQLNRTTEAAGGALSDIAGGMGGLDRAAADVALRGTEAIPGGAPATGIQGIIDRNVEHIDNLYGTTRARIDMNDAGGMPLTRAALDRVYARRTGRGMDDPYVGLEQAENLASRPNGANFNEAHAARANVRDRGGSRDRHPGYDARDYNEVVRAMTQDIEHLVGMSAARVEQRQNPTTSTGQSRYLAAGRAILNFREAEDSFGPIAELNRRLQRLIDSQGEGAVSTLLNASRAKGGDVRLLADMRRLLPQHEFQQIGGTLLNDIMRTPTGDFSLQIFSNKWRTGVSDEAKNILFSPQTREALDGIAGLGTHLRGAMAEMNRSHTASVLVLVDLAKDAALLYHDLANQGAIAGGGALGATTTTALWLFGQWLASPAAASSINTWRRAYMGATMSPTPARMAAFNLATRNLANNLNLPAEQILRHSMARAGGLFTPQQQNQTQ